MRKFFWFFLEVFETLVIAIVAVFLIRTFVAQPFLVSGSSMEPTFYHGNYLLVDEFTYHFREPQRGEVVVFRYPSKPPSYFIKRIIGLPGEKVILEDGKATIVSNEGTKKLEETYISQRAGGERFETTLGPEQYFVLGDNRNFSYDSRSWGALDRSHIIGVARLRLWPFNEVMAFSAPRY
jgi:signal peptidase I